MKARPFKPRINIQNPQRPIRQSLTVKLKIWNTDEIGLFLISIPAKLSKSIGTKLKKKNSMSSLGRPSRRKCQHSWRELQGRILKEQQRRIASELPKWLRKLNILSSDVIVGNISTPLLHLHGPIYIRLSSFTTVSGRDHSLCCLQLVLLGEVFYILNLILD